MPLFHSNAVVGGWSRRPSVAGATMVPAKFSASGFLHDIRRYGATYMNYVGKPLAYVLATQERPDDGDNPLRVAFGNEATDRDIEEFGRRFDCKVDGRIRLDRERGDHQPRGPDPPTARSARLSGRRHLQHRHGDRVRRSPSSTTTAH